MTRRLRPPAPLCVRCHPDGRPASLRRGGRERTITRIAATWARPAPWWAIDDSDGDGGSAAPCAPLRGERTYFRVVADGSAVYIIFQETRDGTWHLETIID
jgi:hypothetical protein